MRETFLSFLLLLSFLLPAAAQKENNNWCFGYNAGLTFNTVPSDTFILHNDFNAGNATSAAASDANGNLLFYTNGMTIWDRNNNIMPNGDTIYPTPYPAGTPTWDRVSNAIIIPDPANSNRYYIFSAPQIDIQAPGWDYELRYSIVDMGLHGGLGDVLPGYKSILLDTGLCSAMVAAGKGYCDKWIIVHQNRSDVFHAFKITAAGVSNAVVSVSGLSFTDDGGQMRITSDDQTLAYCISRLDTLISYQESIQLFHFDMNTGLISKPLLLDSLNDVVLGVLSIEFSPDNSRLYYTREPVLDGGNLQIVQLDLNTGSREGILSTQKVVSQDDNNGGTMQLGPDGKIYFSDHNADVAHPLLISLGVIDSPNNVGVACHVRNDAIQYDPFQIVEIGNLCNPMPLSQASISYNRLACHLPDTLSSPVLSATYTWSTGATGKAIVITQPGLYWVKATQSCGGWLVDTFHVSYRPHVPLQDTFSCSGLFSIAFDSNNYYQWSNGTTGPSFSTAQTGSYAVTTMVEQCVYQDNFHVYVYPPAGAAILPADTTICNSAMAASLSCLYDMGQYTWSTGATDRAITVTQPGSYWLQSVTPCGVYSDTVHVRFCPPVIDTLYASADTACSGQCLLFNATAHNYPESYHWELPGGNPSYYDDNTPFPICYNTPGNYTARLVVSNSSGADSMSLNITVLPRPVASFTDTTISVPYNSTLVLPSCGAASRTQWYVKDSLVCDACDQYRFDALYYLTNYKCIVSNGDCSDSCNYKVVVTGIPTDDAWLPTAFSPNGDGRNDHFHLITVNPNIEVMTLSVYDRWGARIYSGIGNDASWDGYAHGQPAQIGVYFWMLGYRVADGKTVYYKRGDVTLVR